MSDNRDTDSEGIPVAVGIQLGVNVERHTVEEVAEHYGLSADEVHAWIGRLKKFVSYEFMGTLDCDLMRDRVDQFEQFGRASDDEVREAFRQRGSELAVRNEYVGRGLVQPGDRV